MKRTFAGRRLLADRLKDDLKSAKFRKSYEEADLPVRIAIQIAQLREKRGLTQSRLARKIGTRQQVISRIENFEQQNLTLKTLQKIARALDAQLFVDFRPLTLTGKRIEARPVRATK